MLKNVKQIVLRGLLLILVLTILVSVSIIRRDIPLETIKEDYFTTYSAFEDITILNEEGEDLEITIHYQELGDSSNETIVLLHGSFSSSHTFSDWADRLIEENYHVILMDLPYYGLSGPFPDKLSSLKRSSDVLKGLLDTLGITTIHIGGNSLGGGVAYTFTSHYPNMVESLLLIDAIYPSGIIQQSRYFLGPVFSKIDPITKYISLHTPRFVIKNMLKTAYGNPSTLSEETIDRYYEILRREHTRKYILEVSRVEAESVDTLNNIPDTIPINIMWGEKDNWIPVSTAYQFQETLDLDTSNMYIYPELGHVPMEEDPTTVEDYINILHSD